MDGPESGDFLLSDDVRAKLKDKSFVKSALAQGVIPRDLLGFSAREMAQFHKAAIRLFEREKYEDAANAFLFLVTLNPHRASFWIGLGMCVQKSGRYEEAVDAYELAALYQLENPIPYFYLAKCFFALHDHDNAAEALHLAVEYAGDRSEYAEIKRLAIQAQKHLEGRK